MDPSKEGSRQSPSDDWCHPQKLKQGQVLYTLYGLIPDEASSRSTGGPLQRSVKDPGATSHQVMIVCHPTKLMFKQGQVNDAAQEPLGLDTCGFQCCMLHAPKI